MQPQHFGKSKATDLVTNKLIATTLFCIAELENNQRQERQKQEIRAA